MIRHLPPAFPARSLAAALCLVLAGCSGQAPPAGDGPVASAAAPAAPPAEQLAGVSAPDLRKRAQLALREKRVFAPAGDNAIEFYIALRARSATTDSDTQGALMELQPYAVIAAEQALARSDLTEAERLRRLVAAIDPDAPSLGRIAEAIKAKIGAEAQAALELAAVVEAPARIEAIDPPDAATSTPEPSPTSSPPVRTAPPVAAASTSVAPSPPPAPAAAPVPAAPVATARAASPAPSQDLIPVRTPQPEYPASTRRNGATGQVVASFTVLSDGSIGAIGVESVGARQMAFERSVLAAVKRWKYQPPGEERNVRMSFAFAP